MNNKVVVAVIAVWLPAICHADKMETITRSNNEVSVSYLFNRMNYVEPDPTGAMDNGFLDKETGNQNGVQLLMKSQRHLVNFADDLYLEGRYTHISGQTAYQGHLQTMLDPTFHPDYSTTTDDRINEVMLRAGLSHFNEDQILATSYLQYDYRDWDRSIEGPSGYKEAYMHHALGIGMRFQESPAERLVVTEELGYSRALYSHMETVDFITGQPMRFHLGNGNIYTVGLAADYAVNQRVHLTAAYDYQHFSYGHSGDVDGMMEPNSWTSLQRVKFGIAYMF